MSAPRKLLDSEIDSEQSIWIEFMVTRYKYYLVVTITCNNHSNIATSLLARFWGKGNWNLVISQSYPFETLELPTPL